MVNLLENDTKALIKDIVFIIVFFLIFWTFGWAAFHIPSSSMEPTLEVGDRIFVSKWAYGYNRYSVPFDPNFVGENKLFESKPDRGDVVVFTKNNTDYIKRLIGLPGDRIQVKQGHLYLNDKLVSRVYKRDVTFTDYRGQIRHLKEYEEALPSSNGGDPIVHRIYEASDQEPFVDNTIVYVVPEGHAFMMGDNRDGSADSRYLHDIGFVKFEYIVGKAQVTTFSLYDCDQGKDVYCLAGIPFGRFFNVIN